MLHSKIHRIAAASILALSTWTVSAFAQSEVTPDETTPVVAIGKQALLMKDGQLRVQVDVACGSRWKVTEATVHVMQNGQQSSDVNVPAVCGSSDDPARYDVLVPAIPGGYQVGTAEATASVTLQDGDTQLTTPLSDTAFIVVRMPSNRPAPSRGE